MDRVVHDKIAETVLGSEVDLTSVAALIETLDRSGDKATFYRLQHIVVWVENAVSDVIVEVYGYDGTESLLDELPCYSFRFEAGSDTEHYTRIVGGPYDQFKVYARLSTSDDDGDTSLQIRRFNVQSRIEDA